MTSKFLLPFLSVSLITSYTSLRAASVGFSIGGQTDTLLFETAGGDPLSGGSLLIGAYNGVPSVGIGVSDLEENFTSFGSPAGPSAGFGNFAGADFISNVVPSGGSFDFRSQQIYALVLDTNSLSTATELAFFTADGIANWVFPTLDDGGIDPDADVSTDIVLNEQNNLLIGSNDTLTITGAGSFSSIQLSAVPEPSSSFLLIVSSLLLGQRRKRK